jgi:Fur family ferric uptake transcriptional regulator
MAASHHAQTARKMLASAGIRNTMPRIAVLTALLEAHRPLSAERLAERLAELQADEVTIYRILRTFAEKGLAHQVDVGDRVWRFAACGDEEHNARHAHFVCRKCGELECLDEDAEQVPPKLPTPRGHTVENQEVLLRGLCADCRKPK